MSNAFYADFDFVRLERLEESKAEHRSPFQVDRDRVLFTFPFRRLQSKTQVFPSGEYDFYRTRLTHSLEVARIGRSICEYLQKKDPLLSDDYYVDSDLVEGVCYAHDLGHPPFGHIGERTMNELLAGVGGFEGNAQTLRLLAESIFPREDRPTGMNPTRAFLDGTMKYKLLRSELCSKNDLGETVYPDNHFIYDNQSIYRDFIFSKKEIPSELRQGKALNKFKSIECQIMDWADDTAYSLADLSDGLQAGFINQSSVSKWAEGQDLSGDEVELLEDLLKALDEPFYFVPRIARMVGKFILACSLEKRETFLSSDTNRYSYNLKIDPKVEMRCDLYKRISFDIIFRSTAMEQIEFRSKEVLSKLFSAYWKNYISDSKPLNLLNEPEKTWMCQAKTEEERAVVIRDAIVGLTDGQASKLCARLFGPSASSVFDLA